MFAFIPVTIPLRRDRLQRLYLVIARIDRILHVSSNTVNHGLIKYWAASPRVPLATRIFTPGSYSIAGPVFHPRRFTKPRSGAGTFVSCAMWNNGAPSTHERHRWSDSETHTSSRYNCNTGRSNSNFQPDPQTQAQAQAELSALDRLRIRRV